MVERGEGGSKVVAVVVDGEVVRRNGGRMDAVEVLEVGGNGGY